MHAGLSHALEFRHPAKGVHHRMHLDATLPPQPVQWLSAHSPQYLAEELNGGTVDDLQVADAQTL